MKASREMCMMIEREVTAIQEVINAERKLKKIRVMKEKLTNRENVALIKKNIKAGVDCSGIKISTKNALQLFIDNTLEFTGDVDDYITSIDLYNNFITFCGEHQDLNFERPKGRLSFLNIIGKMIRNNICSKKQILAEDTSLVQVRTGVKWRQSEKS